MDAAILEHRLPYRLIVHRSIPPAHNQKLVLKAGTVGRLGKFDTDSVLSCCYYKLVGIKSKDVSERKA